MIIGHLTCTCYVTLQELKSFVNIVLYEMLSSLLLYCFFIKCILTPFHFYVLVYVSLYR